VPEFAHKALIRGFTDGSAGSGATFIAVLVSQMREWLREPCRALSVWSVRQLDGGPRE
jgi:hypothetical protein